MKLIKSKQEYMPKTEELSLDELFEIAGQFGVLETGGIWGRTTAELTLDFTGKDYVCVKCRKDTLKQSIQECIRKARILKQVYREQL